MSSIRTVWKISFRHAQNTEETSDGELVCGLARKCYRGCNILCWSQRTYTSVPLSPSLPLKSSPLSCPSFVQGLRAWEEESSVCVCVCVYVCVRAYVHHFAFVERGVKLRLSWIPTTIRHYTPNPTCTYTDILPTHRTHTQEHRLAHKYAHTRQQPADSTLEW